MNAHIPDQLKQLSKKELVEFAKTAHGYSVELNVQLAKANERVKELELVIVAITHADETGYVDDVGFVQGWNEVCDETKSLLNKFAIEKKIEVLESLSLNPNNESEDRIVAVIDERIEQLRKDQS